MKSLPWEKSEFPEGEVEVGLVVLQVVPHVQQEPITGTINPASTHPQEDPQAHAKKSGVGKVYPGRSPSSQKGRSK